MTTQQCSLKYHRYKKKYLTLFINEIQNGIYSNPAIFIAPPIPFDDFEEIKETYFICTAKYDMYGIPEKTRYLDARRGMFAMLDTLAKYIERIAAGDSSIIHLSGFKLTITDKKKSATLAKIKVFDVKPNGNRGELLITIQAITYCREVQYICLCFQGATPPEIEIFNGQLRWNSDGMPLIIDTNRSRRKKITGLTSGSLYHLFVYATNAVSVSPLSDVKSIYAN